MDIHTFMTNYREAFGERAELPLPSGTLTNRKAKQKKLAVASSRASNR